TGVEEMEASIRTVCESIFKHPLKDISFCHLLLNLFQTARRFNMEVQPQLVLLQKTLLNIEGLGRQLYPDLDLWSTARPYLERWMKERAGLHSLWKSLKHQAPELSHRLPELPVLAHQALLRAEHSHLQQQRQSESIQRIDRQLTRRGRRGSRFQRIGLVIIALALAWQPLVQWVDGQPWTVL